MKRTVVGAWIALAACSSGDPSGDAAADVDAATSDTATASDAEATLPTLSWSLDWDTSAISSDADGWSVVADDGLRVEIDAGTLVTYGGQWVECETARATRGERVREAVRSLFISTAWAGHSGSSANATTVEGTFEDLATLQGQSWAAALVAPVDYCRVHYLVARADDSVEAWAERPEMDRLTLVLAGRWYDPEGEAHPFEVATASANGVFLDLDGGRPLDGAGGPFEVTITRDAAAWLLGVDWGGTDPDDLGTALLSSLMRASRVDVVEP